MSQGGEKARAQLEADGEYEQDEPELLDEVERMVIDRFAEMADEDAGKQDTCRTESNPTKFGAAERHADDANEREDSDRMSDGLGLMKLEDPAHEVTSSVLSSIASATSPNSTGTKKRTPVMAGWPENAR